MRAVQVAMALLLVSCGETFQKQNECRKVFEAICNHEQACGRVNDLSACVTDLQDTSECDLDKTIADYQLCETKVAEAECVVFKPCVCGDILCDKAIGCHDEVNPYGCDTGGGGGTSSQSL
jgi:hypothetical protein